MLKHRLNQFIVSEEDRLAEGGHAQKLAQARQLLQHRPRAGWLAARTNPEADTPDAAFGSGTNWRRLIGVTTGVVASFLQSVFEIMRRCARSGVLQCSCS
jgi:hypothetical protein